MMMSKVRFTGRRATWVAGSLMFFVAINQASGGIISDRSAFVGDFTVIDFETRGDGTPLILDANDFWEPHIDEYASWGFSMDASTNVFGHDLPFIANATGHPQSVAALQAAGSAPNVMFASGVPGFVQFSFPIPISAVGMAIINRTDSGIVRLETFDAQGSLIEAVDFVGDLIDGTVLGSDFGTDYDFDYGFLGVSASDVPISLVVLREWRTTLDDLHFSIIPEPSSIALWCVAAGILFSRTKRRCSREMKAILLTVIATSSILASSAHATVVQGQVTAWVMTEEHAICGDDGPLSCVQEPLAQVPLQGVRVCESGLSCTFTDEQGDYQLTVTDDASVDIEADLDGLGTRVGEFVFDPILNQLVFTLAPPLLETFDSDDPPANNRIDFVFNANPNPVSEVPTVEANIFYHTMLVREFYLQRHPSFTGLNVQIASDRSVAACTQASFSPPILLMSFPESGSQSGTSCVAKADRSVVAHEYGHVIHNALGLDDLNTDEAFREGFADTVALLVYDFPDLFIGHGGEGTFKSYDFASNPSLRKVDPCSTAPGQCQDPQAPLGPPDPNCCGSIRAGIWWDIKLNMQAKYGVVGAPDCPIDPALNESGACGLELTRQLFVDWSTVTKAGPVEFMLAEILDLDDDDGDLWNGSPNFAQKRGRLFA